MNAVATVEPGALLENVIVKGDLSGLNPAERVSYYKHVCDSAGLNPLTKPFEYLTLNGKLVLYARRDATDQLRAIHGVSVVDLEKKMMDGLCVVTVKVQNAKGRTDMATGAVNVASLKGDALANAIMKSETKAKRRATLSICGLGLLDETELETIPEVVNAAPVKRTQAEISATAARKRQDLADCQADINQLETLYALERYEKEVLTPEFMAALGMKSYALAETLERRRAELKAEAESHAGTEESFNPETGELWPTPEAEDWVEKINLAQDKPALASVVLAIEGSQPTDRMIEFLRPHIRTRKAILAQASPAEELPIESQVEASRRHRNEIVEFMKGAKTMKAVDTFALTNFDVFKANMAPEDVTDCERAIEAARKRVSK